MKKPKILVIGSSNTDMIIKLDRLPRPGETILGGEFATAAGGKGANQAIAAVRAGGEISFIARVGMDMFGEQAVRRLLEEGINVEYVIRDAVAPSGVALINVAQDGENSIAVAAGANGRLSPADLEQAAKVMAGANLVLMQLEIPVETVEYVAEMATKKGIKVILNPAPARALSNSLLKNLYIIIPNRNEAEILSGIKVSDIDSAKQAADIISAKGVDIVVITLGSQGALIKEYSEYHFVEAYKVDALDTTAAGDTFCGSVCVGLSEGRSILDSVKLAARAAAITVTRMGAQASIPYRSELSSLDVEQTKS